MIPIHPQAGSEHPDEIDWTTPQDILPFTGPVARMPPALSALVEDGTLAQVRVRPDAVTTRLGEGRRWRVEGPRVRAALHAALMDLDAWAPADGPAGPDGKRGPGGSAAGGQEWELPPSGVEQTTDERLRVATEALLRGPAGDLARSHGGRIELVRVHDGVVEVRMHGACHGCPLARSTLTGQLETRLRPGHPQLREVRPVAGGSSARTFFERLRRG